MNILFLSTWFPYPLDTGSRIRVHYLLRALAERHTVDLISFLPEAGHARFLPEVRAWCRRVEVVPRDPFRRDRTRAMMGYLSARPRNVVATYSAEMESLARELARTQSYGAAIASCTNAAPYALAVRGVPRLLEEHNFMSRWMEEQYRAQRSPARRALRRLTWQKCLRYERRLYPQFQACTLVSEQDRSAAERAIPACRGRLHVLPNGVDLEHNRPGLAQPQPDSLAFNGAPAYSANAEAMRWFAGEVWPLVRRERPAAALTITGRSDGVDLDWLPADGSIQVTGYLEDVRPVVAGSWACVAPLLSGGGTRLKILEAMALGTPVVATSKGAEGLDVTPEHDILIADGAEQFAGQVVRLLADAGLRARLAANGRRLVEAGYGWAQIGELFCGLVERVAGGERA